MARRLGSSSGRGERRVRWGSGSDSTSFHTLPLDVPSEVTRPAARIRCRTRYVWPLGRPVRRTTSCRRTGPSRSARATSSSSSRFSRSTRRSGWVTSGASSARRPSAPGRPPAAGRVDPLVARRQVVGRGHPGPPPLHLAVPSQVLREGAVRLPPQRRAELLGAARVVLDAGQGRRVAVVRAPPACRQRGVVGCVGLRARGAAPVASRGGLLVLRAGAVGGCRRRSSRVGSYSRRRRRLPGAGAGALRWSGASGGAPPCS